MPLNLSAHTLLCPICGETGPAPLDERESVPIAQNLMYRSREAAVNCPQGELLIVRCMACGFAWNAAFDQALLKYDEDYENDQSLSPAFDRHLDEVAEAIRAHAGVQDDLAVVEIGCGQGYFLYKLANVFGERLTRLIGFDPAFRPGSAIPAIARVERGLFDVRACEELGAMPDLVVTRHVIEHVPDPLAFLKAIRDVCAPGTAIAVETPSLQWILDGAVAHDLYYEHCSLFDPESLTLAMETAGFAVSGVTERLEGQYLLALGRAAERVEFAPRRSRPDNADYPARRADYVAHWRRTFAEDRKAGETLALWGGGSKGVTLALLLGEGCSDLSAAIDINPVREGSFMPVTGIPVILPDTARSEGITKAYVVNPVYLAEVEQYCRQRGWDVKLGVVR